jgi:5-methylcytosine-specific restriction endonuclease McrA
MNLVYKTCSKCGVEKPIEDFRVKRGQCISCEKLYSKNYKLQNREKFRELNKLYLKKWAANNRDKKHQMDREYYQENKDKIKTCAKQYRENNLEKCRLNSKSYRERNKGILSIKKKVWANANKGKRNISTKKWVINNPEKAKEMGKNWRKLNLVKGRLYSHKYNSLKKQNGGVVEKSDIESLLLAQKSRCFYCDSKLGKYEIEHIIPLSKGGEHKLYNIVLACVHCNRTKGNKHPEEFVNQVLTG